jgi:hypothetical protein
MKIKLFFLGLLLSGWSIGQSQQLILQYSNQVAPNTTVYTFLLNPFQVNPSQQDTDVIIANSQQVDSIHNLLSNVNGVTEVIFDKATALFTVIGVPNLLFEDLLNQHNEN